MPPHWNLERLIGTAVFDTEFRGALLSSPLNAATDFDLSNEELEALGSASTNSLEDLAADLYAWIIRATRPKRPQASPRWSLDYRPERVAV